MPFIELHLASHNRPILFNTALISALCARPEGEGPTITINGEEYYLIKESYEAVKTLILQAEKA